MACELIAGLARRGWDVQVKPIRFESTCNTYNAPVPMEITEKFTMQPKAELELLISPMDRPNLPTPGKRSIYYTMIESTRLSPRQTAIINKAHAAIATGQWQKQAFERSGVKVPVYTVPLGISPEIFIEHPIPQGGCVFGAGGCLASGARRKRLDVVINAFRDAFDGINDVELRLKVLPGEKLDLPDPRIRCNAEFMSWLSLHRWYQGLTCFVNIGVEGWGLMLNQAMACGRPGIAMEFGGSTEFFDRSVGYPLEHWVQWNAIGNRSAGAFAIPDTRSLIHQMRRVYLDRQEAAEFGVKSAERARQFTWEHAVDRLESVLKEMK